MASYLIQAVDSACCDDPCAREGPCDPCGGDCIGNTVQGSLSANTAYPLITSAGSELHFTTLEIYAEGQGYGTFEIWSGDSGSAGTKAALAATGDGGIVGPATWSDPDPPITLGADEAALLLVWVYALDITVPSGGWVELRIVQVPDSLIDVVWELCGDTVSPP